MDFFGVLQLVGGLCLFLFGMETMGDGLKRASGSKLEEILGKLTSSVPKGVLFPSGYPVTVRKGDAVGFGNVLISKQSLVDFRDLLAL